MLNFFLLNTNHDQDSLAALRWLQGRLPEGKEVLVWGHSMGTGIACHALALHFKSKEKPAGVKGLVLESPFNNFTDEFIEKTSSTSNPVIAAALAALYKITGDVLPEALLKFFNMEFNSDEWIKDVQCPVLILHAQDDEKIPIKMAYKLYECATEGGKKGVQFQSFHSEMGLGHHDIYLANNLSEIIKTFVDTL